MGVQTRDTTSEWVYECYLILRATFILWQWPYSSFTGYGQTQRWGSALVTQLESECMNVISFQGQHSFCGRDLSFLSACYTSLTVTKAEHNLSQFYWMTNSIWSKTRRKVRSKQSITRKILNQRWSWRRTKVRLRDEFNTNITNKVENVQMLGALEHKLLNS